MTTAQEKSIYIFTVQPGPIRIHVPEDMHVYLADTEDQALKFVKQSYKPGQIIQVEKRSTIPVSHFLSKLNDLQPKPEPEVKIDTKDRFITSVMLISEEFVKSKTDQAALKKILSKLTKTKYARNTRRKNTK